MYSKFKFNPTNHFYNSVLNPYIESGRVLYNKYCEESKRSLKNFIYDNDIIDGNRLKESWFQIEEADVFLSHSHKDINKVIAFAGWLYEKFELKSFIDSCCWGYCDDLLKLLDDK